MKNILLSGLIIFINLLFAIIESIIDNRFSFKTLIIYIKTSFKLFKKELEKTFLIKKNS